MNTAKERTLAEEVSRLASEAFSITRSADALYDKVEAMELALKGEVAKATQDEIDQLRNRLESTEDALRRELRKNMRLEAALKGQQAVA